MDLKLIHNWQLQGWFNLLCWLLVFWIALPIKAEQVRISIKVQGTQKEQQHDYFSNLLVKALEASKADNEIIDIIYSPRDYSQARWISLLQRDTGNFVIWTMTDTQREQQLRAIRIPLFKGLFGYRVLLIRKGEQSRFDHVKTIEDLANFMGGQGTHWPDTRILEANGLPLLRAHNTESLFRMIEAKRFDYFPRGVSEAWFELLERNETNLVVEQNLLLYYPADIYFFVNRNNAPLAARIEKGLEMLIDNGEFDRFFFSHPRVITAFNKLHHRRILNLTNPFLPPQTPIDNPRYWIDLKAMNRESTANP